MACEITGDDQNCTRGIGHRSIVGMEILINKGKKEVGSYQLAVARKGWL